MRVVWDRGRLCGSQAVESGSCSRLSYAQGVNRLIYDAFNPQDHVQPCLMFDVFLSSPGLWRNSCPAPVRDRHCILIAHRSAVTALNSLQVPHIFNHFDCHLSNAAKTCCNFSHSLTLESRSPIKGLPRSLGFSLSYLPSFLFHDVSFSPRLSPSVFPRPMCQCAVALSQRAVVFVARKVDMCGIGCSDAKLSAV